MPTPSNGGRILLVLDIVVGPFGTIVGGQAFLCGDGAAAVVGLTFLLVPGLIGLACIPIVLRAPATPTAGGSVRIGPENLAFTLRRGRTFSIPWADASHGGSGPVLAVIQIPHPLTCHWRHPQTTGTAERLRSKPHHGWMAEAVDPGSQLLGNLESCLRDRDRK
jgi:hypothetical protein